MHREIRHGYLCTIERNAKPYPVPPFVPPFERLFVTVLRNLLEYVTVGEGGVIGVETERRQMTANVSGHRTANLKSASLYRECGFESLPGHHLFTAWCRRA